VSVEETLAEMNLALPAPPKPVGAYVPWTRSGKVVFLAGQIPMRDGKAVVTGKLGRELTVESCAEALEIATLNALAAVKAAVGDLDKVKHILKVTGYVASAEGFTDQAGVLNHASNLLIALFGDRGRHARVAIGVAELPLGVPVELDITVEVE